MDNQKHIARTIEDAINGTGMAFDVGCPIGQESVLWEQAELININNKAIRLVSRWQWWDLEIEDEDTARAIDEAGVFPSMIYSDFLIQDSSHKFNRGDWVRSTLLTDLHGSIFETRNTLYLLSGSGIRKSVDIKTAFSRRWEGLAGFLEHMIKQKKLS